MNMSDALWTVEVKGQVQKPAGYRGSGKDNLLDVIFREAGGMANSRFGLKAVLVGGTLGKFAGEAEITATIHQSLEIMVFDEGSCLVNIVRMLLAYNQAGLVPYRGCHSCKAALAESVSLLGKLCSAEGNSTHLARLRQLADIRQPGCEEGCAVLNPLRSALLLYGQEFEYHAGGQCPASICGELVISPCRNSCPAGVDLPGTIALMQMGKYDDAVALGRHDNPFFLTCGFVCEDPPCQKNCKRLAFDEAVYSQAMHRFAGEKAARRAGELAKALMHPAIKAGSSSGKRVAVAGAGPAGLSAAYFLARFGHHVAVYEKAPVAGGMTALGIPAYRIDRQVLAEEINAIRALGVEIKTNCSVGTDIRLDELRHDYDSVLLTVGAGGSRQLGIPGEDLPGILGATEFLAGAALTGGGPVGLRVLVVGGGNVAVDAARTARRLGAQRVEMMCVEDRFEMPASRHEIAAAEAEGIIIRELSIPVAFQGSDRIEKVIFAAVTPGPYELSGRRWPPRPLEHREEREFDTVIIAIGQIPEIADLSGLLTKRGPFIAADDSYATNLQGVFTAGDCSFPVNTVVKAVKAGKEAAYAIDKYLMGSVRILEVDLRKKLGCFTGACVCHIAPQVGMPEQDSRLRIHNFELVELGLTDEQANYEMMRCVCAAKGAV
jgi:NADH-quinone oxidoreductase subunit F